MRILYHCFRNLSSVLYKIIYEIHKKFCEVAGAGDHRSHAQSVEKVFSLQKQLKAFFSYSILLWEKVARFTATDEVFIMLISSSRQRTHSIHARQPFYAGVQTMRARICSAFSCAVFARVVWLRLRRVRDYRLSLCYLPHALATHYFLRLTRARGRRFLRGWKILLNDFCR